MTKAAPNETAAMEAPRRKPWRTPVIEDATIADRTTAKADASGEDTPNFEKPAGS